MGTENERTTLSIESIPKNVSEAQMEQSSEQQQEESNNDNPDPLENYNRVRMNEKNVRLVASENEKLILKEDEDKYEFVPPDGGYAWLVLCGAMLINILIPGGAIKSFGILFVEFLEQMDASPTAASWIPALCYFLYSSLGPLSSILSVKYSYRTVTLLGAGFCSAGMILTHWATSIEYLYISYGVFVGIGAGLSFPPTVYIVTSYFTSKRGLANGLCISGSALGSILLPPLLRVLLDHYGYRGACLIMGAITLNCFIAAIYYDPVEMHMKKVKIEKSDEQDDDDNYPYGRLFRTEKILEDLEEEPEALNENGNKKAKFILTHDESNTPVGTPTMEHKIDVFRFSVPRSGFERSASAVVVQNFPHSERTRKISTPLKDEHRNGTVNSFVGQLNSTPSLVSNTNSSIRLNRFQSNRLSARKSLKASPSTSSFQYISTPYHGTLTSLQPNEFSSHLSLRSIASSLNPLKSADARSEAAELTGLNKYFDLSLLTDPVYLIIMISNCANAISYTNFIILLPAYALELGFDKDYAAYLLSIVSTFDLIGRIGGSALSDLNLIPKTWFFVCGLMISGVGLTCLGVYIGITALVMADLLGEERLTSSYGISLFVNGILQLLGPPLCLSIFERIGGYRPIFLVLGLCLLAGSSLWCCMPCVQRRKLLLQEEAAAAAQMTVA
ncbi:CLUMA_CG000776, isoform A [Clunio marinus]|uniref:CLUMA_CG000776, isoform A n=1 Tax=Clunio marinus TaxID=568069 RepID=A0A1J1HG34_9DIPT|nr:CLUMA_CG000776, isoform A [Clunio marinus]